jgi:hypothetical protein
MPDKIEVGRGDTNADIPKIKDALRAKGYAIASTDAVLDAETEAAIRSEQGNRRDEQGRPVSADGKIKDVRDKWVLLASPEEKARLWALNGYTPNEGD